MWWSVKKINMRNVSDHGQAYKKILGAMISQDSKDDYAVNLWEVFTYY